MAIKQSQSVKDYTDRANYVFWTPDSSFNSQSYSVNIAAKWNAGKSDIEGIVLYYSWNKAAKQQDILSFELKDLALYQNGSLTDVLKLCLDFFTEMRDNVNLDQNYWKNAFEQKKTLLNIKASLTSNFNLILTGAPGTGKTFLAKNIAADIIGCNMNALNTNNQYGFVQFHPSYDYTDFVEGLRPKQIGNQIGFERQDGIFKAFCAKAAKEFRNAKEEGKKPKPFVFVIDEINRGEISKIFGELFYSIDHGYRGEKGIVDTQYHNLILTDNESKAQDYPFKKGFYVPENVLVIGTMNDIDRSVESMDFAFRRRFVFYEVSAKQTQESILFACPFKDVAIKKMDTLNALIVRDGFSPAYHIGASYFQRIKEYNGDFDKLWQLHLRGLLFEYLRGLPDAESVLKRWEDEYKNA